MVGDPNTTENAPASRLLDEPAGLEIANAALHPK